MDNDNQKIDVGELTEKSNIHINTGVLKERRSSYLSLSDLYQIQLFTNKNFLIVEELKQENEEYNQQIAQSVFAKPMLEQEERDLESLLFMETLGQVKKIDYSSLKKDDEALYIFGAIVVSLTFLIVIIRYNIWRKKRRVTYVNDFDLEASTGA